MAEERTTISLVLGSGGARGLAHIGIIQWLEEHDYEIRSISGCSMGALIGGIYACGKLDTYTEWVRAIDKFDMVRLLDISWGKAGLVEGEKIIDTLAELIGDRKIEDLPIRFTAVSADIANEKEIWIASGSVFEAIRASISLPLFFTPVEHGKMTLLDGGILNPVPIAPTFHDDTDLTIAVNLGGAPEAETKLSAAPTRIEHSPEEESIIDSVRETIGEFLDDMQARKTRDGGDWGMLDIAVQTFDTMQGAIARQKLAAYPPDHTIIIPRNAASMLEFDRADEMIALGYAAAEEQLGD